jgi:predicted metallopeptidase
MNLDFMRAEGVEIKVKDIINVLGWGHINAEFVRCVFSRNSTSRALARIWSTPRIFSAAFDTKPMYVIELLYSKYMTLSDEDKTKVLIHELLHIPKTFSGALKPHLEMSHTLNCRTVDGLYRKYLDLRNI